LAVVCDSDGRAKRGQLPVRELDQQVLDFLTSMARKEAKLRTVAFLLASFVAVALYYWSMGHTDYRFWIWLHAILGPLGLFVLIPIAIVGSAYAVLRMWRVENDWLELAVLSAFILIPLFALISVTVLTCGLIERCVLL
jgi:hypothetical protein